MRSPGGGAPGGFGAAFGARAGRAAGLAFAAGARRTGAFFAGLAATRGAVLRLAGFLAEIFLRLIFGLDFFLVAMRGLRQCRCGFFRKSLRSDERKVSRGSFPSRARASGTWMPACPGRQVWRNGPASPETRSLATSSTMSPT